MTTMADDYVYIFDGDEFNGDLQWDQSQWIGCGRTYKDVPEDIAKIGENLLEIPSPFVTLIPSNNLSILDFIAIAPSLPLQDEVPIVPPTQLDWSDDEPDSFDFDDLSSLIVPSLKAITRLNDSFGQAWFDSKRSLKDACPGVPQRRYLFWVKTYFYDMRQACRISDKWCAAMKWLQEASLVEAEDTMKEKVYALLGTSRGWSGSICGLANDIKVEFLADLLGNNPLPNGIVDALLNLLSLRLQHLGLTSHFLITSTEFSNSIEWEAWKDDGGLGSKDYLDKYGTWFQ